VTRGTGTELRSLTAAQYHADDLGDTPTLSASVAHILCTQSPAHARAAHPKLNPQHVRQDEQRFDVGTAAHALLLEGREAVQVVDAADWRTKEAKLLRDDAREQNRIPLLAAQWADVQAMCESVREQLAGIECAPPLFVDGKPEQPISWEDDYGVMCRALVDWLHDDFTAIDDLKTTARSANPEGWTRTTMLSIGADIQACFYTRGIEKITGVRPEFRFVIAETSEPFAVSVVSPGPEMMALAEKKVAYALRVWAQCLRNGVWPAYPARVAYAELPGWEESRWLEKELREGDA